MTTLNPTQNPSLKIGREKYKSFKLNSKFNKLKYGHIFICLRNKKERNDAFFFEFENSSFAKLSLAELWSFSSLFKTIFLSFFHS